jgi:hypothetical protein
MDPRKPAESRVEESSENFTVGKAESECLSQGDVGVFLSRLTLARKS